LAAALTINNQLKVATAAMETATMTATTMTMETKVTAATCCCLRRRRQAGRRLRAAAALPLPPSPSAGRQATTKRAADGAITNHHCLSIGFVGIDGGFEHYLPFHQPHSDNFMPDTNHQQIWLIALPVAQPPPIRLVPLHPNTMGNATNVRFCQNHWWGRVIGGFCRCN
jgi:hypothetical protein